MKSFWAVFVGRNMEFLRDRGSMVWTFGFPLMIIIGCAFAFSRPDEHIVTVGILDNLDIKLADKPWVQAVTLTSEEEGLQQVRHHQINLLVGQDEYGWRYWYNSDSAASEAAVAMLEASDAKKTFAGEAVTGQRVRYVDWVMPGVLAMNMMFSSLFGVGYVIIRYRQNGVLKRIQATPVTAFQFLSAQLCSRLLIVLTVNCSIFVACYLLLDLLVLGSFATLAVIALCGALPLTALGLLVASRTASEELGGGMLNTATWPMMLLSEIWFSLDNSPAWMQQAAQFLPLTHLVTAAREVMIEGASFSAISGHILVLLLMTAVFLSIASILFRWQKDG